MLAVSSSCVRMQAAPAAASSSTLLSLVGGLASLAEPTRVVETCRYVECDLQEVTIEELEVSRPANEARIVAAIEETRAWVDAKTGQVGPRIWGSGLRV